MIKVYCDRCNSHILNGTEHVWHRALPHGEGKGHFDLCANCDYDLMRVINLNSEVDVS